MLAIVCTKAARNLFGILWSFVIFVSVIDGFLAVYSREVLVDLERNPIGRFLLMAAGGSVWLLLLSKLIGTIVACAAVLIINRIDVRLGMVVITILALFQFCLLLFLCIA